ncbi:MAG TPA: decarboxylating 6-phosphogluconate dehydrogenase [Burkholderiales bacterium]|jgi:6-phosphogluconate dehydrogenase|nr:decarboxylating 6-phosphogluconate dehydrogenase [Burkholderiales bacterium]HSF20842.1 decarboxylating 6-phosphogluconate dehydrogenase [Burkholderiales bacterium]
MEIGIIGLGRMGAGMARRLAHSGARIVCYDHAEAAREALAGEENVERAENLAALCARLDGERVMVLSLPAGAAVEDTIRDLIPLCSAGDTIVDCGNSYYKDSMRRALGLSQQGLRYIDAGVSGGIHGLEGGYCLMLGGTPKSIEIFEPFAKALAPHAERGWLHCGPSGAGHFAKMIHNGIEYGMMQALAEGFALLAARRELDIDVARLAETWRHGSVVRSWLLDLCVDILKDENFLQVAPVVADSGEGRWTALESIELGVPAPAIAAALMNRFSSQGRSDYTRRLLAMMRARFGGHPTEKLRPG